MQARDNKWGIPQEMLIWVFLSVVPLILGFFVALFYPKLMAAFRDGSSRDVPIRLHVYIGGWDGPSYSLTLTNEVLVYRSGGGGPPTDFAVSTQYLHPRAIQWAQFRQALDAVRIWAWEPRYVNEHVLDGTQWLVEIAYSNRSISVEGSNAYPGSDGLERSESFNQFLQAVETLMDGRRCQ